MTRDLPVEVQRRVDAVREYGIMDSPPEATFDEVVRLASGICGTPIAAITILDDRRQWFKARVGLDAEETPIEHAFCARTIELGGEDLVVTDARADARFCHNPFVVGEPLIRFYAGVPLITPDGVPIGALCVVDRRPRHLSRTKREILRTLAREIVCLMEAARLSHALRDQRTALEALSISEAYFRHLTEHALDLITILGADGTILFESRSIERELGHRPEHYRDRNAFDFVHPDDRAGVMEAFSEALQRGGNTRVIRFRFLHADGSYRMLEGSGNNLLGDQVVRGLVFNSRDVTERVRLQEKVERNRQEKEDTLACLTGGVAHDFNNILTAVQGLSELTLARVPKGSPEGGYLTEIQASVRRASLLTQQLLAFSRRTVLQPQTLELSSWLDRLRPRFEGIFRVGSEFIIATHGEVCVWQDPTQLEQVLLQLAGNAHDAMPAGGRFSIEVLPIFLGPNERPPDGRDEEVSYVQMSLTDQGYGMSEDTLAHIFEPFFTTKTAGQHPGLGLCMCRGIVEQSGGHLTVRSEPGRGTVVQIYLQTAEAIEDDATPAPLAAASTDVPTILFVDDEPMLREIGETVLTEGGYRVIVAQDGHDALARAAELGSTVLDLLITDVVMPGMTGVQLGVEINQSRPGTRILLCSGYTRDALVQSGGLPAGFAFLPKPYTLNGILAKVAEILNSR